MLDYKYYLTYIIAFILISLSWIGLEFLLCEQIISQTSDNIIAIISSYFITDWIYYRYIYGRK